VLNEYLGFLDKLNKRIRAEQIAALLPKLDLAKRADFEGDKSTPPKKIEKLEKELKRLQKDLKLKSVETRFDEEHNLWAVHFVNAQGAEHIVNWELASTPECRQLIAKFKQIEQYLEPPFVVESVPRPAKAKASADKSDGKNEDTNDDEGENNNEDENLSASEKDEAEKAQKTTGKPTARRAKEPEIVEKNTARELFDYVLNEGRKEYIVQRYKGLGEMTAEQLWETTMDPERRTLLQVRLEDIAECETIFTTLMGEDVEARRKFIEDNALDVKNLDI
jgi:DNA gyrase subunit B